MTENTIYCVTYKGKAGGIVTYNESKAIFPDRELNPKATLGVVAIDKDSIIDKTNYQFAKMRNIQTVTPETYGTLAFFSKIGVPLTVYQGVYGKCIFYKEVYFATTYIKAYDIQGNVLIKEFMDNKKGKGAIDYRQMNEVITWTDITEQVHKQVLADLNQPRKTPELLFYQTLSVVKPIEKVEVILSEQGYLIACGRFESMAIWEDNGVALGAWLGQNYKQKGKEVKQQMVEYMCEKALINGNIPKCSKPTFDLENLPDFIKKYVDLGLIKSYCVVRNAIPSIHNSLFFLDLTEEALNYNVKVITEFLKPYNAMIIDNVKELPDYISNWANHIYY